MKKYTNTAWGCVATGILVLVGYAIALIVNGYFSGSHFNIEWAAHAGAFVGGTVGALWALAGVFFFVAALNLQEESLEKLKESIKAQRDQLEVNREEYGLQREEMEATRFVFEKQSFETTFFALIQQKMDLEQRKVERNNGLISGIEYELQRQLDYTSSSKDNGLIEGNEVSNENFRHSIAFIEVVHNSLYLLAHWIEREGSIQLGEKIPDEFKFYCQMLAGTTSHEGRHLYFKYVTTCDRSYLPRAIQLGFFDRFPALRLTRGECDSCPDLVVVDSLLYYKPNAPTPKAPNPTD